jgi:hypothetical protein
MANDAVTSGLWARVAHLLTWLVGPRTTPPQTLSRPNTPARIPTDSPPFDDTLTLRERLGVWRENRTPGPLYRVTLPGDAGRDRSQDRLTTQDAAVPPRRQAQQQSTQQQGRRRGREMEW